MRLKVPNSVFKFLSLSLLLLPSVIPAQTSAKLSLPVSDTSKAVSEVDRHALYTGAGYGSNMIYLGSSMSQDQPYGYGNLTYGFKNKLYSSVSAVNLSSFEPIAAFYIGGLSYNHVFNSWLDLSAAGYRYQVDSKLTDTLFNSFSYGDITLGIDWRLLYTKISCGGIISKEPSTYLQIKNSRYFQTPEFFNGKANISFDPYVNLLFGTLITSETTEGTDVITTTQQYTTPWSAGSGTESSTGSGTGTSAGYGQGFSSGNGQGSSSGSGQSASAESGSQSSPITHETSSTTTAITTTTTIPVITTSWSESFNLIEIEFGLPVAFNTNFMTIEAEASYVLPAYSDPYFPGPKGFVFTLSCFFKIF